VPSIKLPIPNPAEIIDREETASVDCHKEESAPTNPGAPDSPLIVLNFTVE
jgi:hypothetical protein